MITQDYKKAAAAGEYEENRKAIRRADEILSGKMKPKRGNPNLVKAERLSQILPSLTAAVRYEKGTGPATDYALQAIPHLREIARTMIHTPEGRMLDNRCAVLDACLPGGSEPMAPTVIGSLGFEKAVRDVCGKLPRSAKIKLSDAIFYEMDKDTIRAAMFHKENHVVGIIKNPDENQLRETLAHECAHVVLNHKAGTPEAEQEAEALAKAWGF